MLKQSEVILHTFLTIFARFWMRCRRSTGRVVGSWCCCLERTCLWSTDYCRTIHLKKRVLTELWKTTVYNQSLNTTLSISTVSYGWCVGCVAKFRAFKSDGFLLKMGPFHMAAELTFGVRSSKTRVWSLLRGNLGNEMAGGLSGDPTRFMYGISTCVCFKGFLSGLQNWEEKSCFWDSRLQDWNNTENASSFPSKKSCKVGWLTVGISLRPSMGQLKQWCLVTRKQWSWVAQWSQMASLGPEPDPNAPFVGLRCRKKPFTMNIITWISEGLLILLEIPSHDLVLSFMGGTFLCTVCFFLKKTYASAENPEAGLR